MEFIGPEEGMLACGYEGAGRLAGIEEIVERAMPISAPERRELHAVRA